MQVQHFPETIALIVDLQQTYEKHMRELRKPIPVYTDMEDGLPDEFKGKSTIYAVSATAPAVELAKPRKEGKLQGTSKAELAREIMRETKDKGLPLEAIVEMIMKATGHDKALAKATYKANMGRVGIS